MKCESLSVYQNKPLWRGLPKEQSVGWLTLANQTESPEPAIDYSGWNILNAGGW